MHAGMQLLMTDLTKKKNPASVRQPTGLTMYALNQMHVVVFSRRIFHVGKLLYQPDKLFSAFYMLYAACWAPVDPQDIKT